MELVAGQSQSDVLAAARTWEETGHQITVEAYLDVSLENTGGNTHALAEIRLKAVKVPAAPGPETLLGCFTHCG